MRLFTPDTLVQGHRELVRRTWTFSRQRTTGRPPSAPELEALLLRLANEKSTWGYGKLEREPGAPWAKLGSDVGRSTIRAVRKRHRISPAPHRARRRSRWRTLLRHYKDEMVACDFFTAETAWLKTRYILFCIELGSRRVHFAGCTARST